MKKRLFSILALVTITTTTWADISTKQLETYMKASGVDVMLQNLQEQMTSSITMKAKMKGKEIPVEFLEKISNIFGKKENLAKFTTGIKSLDEKDYNQIIKFYGTPIGKKNAELTKTMNLSTMQQEMIEFSKKPLPKDREFLISKITKLLMSEKKMEKMTKVMMESALNSMPKELQEKIKARMEVQLKQISSKRKQHAQLTTAFTYKDYSNEDLKSLINFYETASGQREINAIIAGSTEYLKVVMPQIMNMSKDELASSKKKLACLNLKSLSNSLMLFKLDNLMFPSQEEGLAALLKNPDTKKYPYYSKKPYLAKMPLDPWGSKIIYSNENENIELISYGADKKAGGEKENSDILLSECH